MSLTTTILHWQTFFFSSKLQCCNWGGNSPASGSTAPPQLHVCRLLNNTFQYWIVCWDSIIVIILSNRNATSRYILLNYISLYFIKTHFSGSLKIKLFLFKKIELARLYKLFILFTLHFYKVTKTYFIHFKCQTQRR